MTWRQTSVVAIATIVFTITTHAQQPAPAGGPDRVAAFKQAVQQSLALARNYEWIETTVISLKGEEKARTQKRCYYGVDGKVQKISLDPPAQPAAKPAVTPSGGRGRGRLKEQIVEKKKDDMKDYMERAAALIHRYVPPSAPEIQAAKDAGRIVVDPPAGGKVHLTVSQYLKPGDSLAIDLDPASSQLLGLAVNSYLDTPDDVVTLMVQMQSLPDGAIVAGQTTLEAKAKNITVVIRNTGHRPAGR